MPASTARRMPASSASVFAPAALGERVVVGRQLDALGAQAVGEREREVGGHERRAQAELRAPRTHTSRSHSSRGRPAAISS